MATATAGTLIAANVSFSLGGKQIPITDAQINVTLSNGCQYTETVLEKGKKGYLLNKGAEVNREGNFHIQTTETPDGNSKDAIKELEKALDLSGKKENPNDYTKDITFSLSTSGGKNFANISFAGFVTEYKEFDPTGTEFSKREATIVLRDSKTLRITG